MKTNFILLLIAFIPLNSLNAQNEVYWMSFDSTYSLERVSLLKEADPWRQTWDSIWTKGNIQHTIIDGQTLRSNDIIIGREGVNLMYEEGMLSDLETGKPGDIRIAPAYRDIFNQAHEINLWVYDNIYADGHKRSKKNSPVFINTPNDKIVENFIAKRDLTKVLTPTLDRWLWRYKLQLYLHVLFKKKKDVLNDFLDTFHNYEQGDSLFWYPFHTMASMVFVSRKESIRSPDDIVQSIELHERNIRMNPGKMYYVYKYASLLYVFKNDYTMPIGISGSEKVAYIKADTLLIYYPGNVELDYIRNFIRYTKQSLDLQQRVFISETEKASIKEIIDKEIIVIDFWGTWCKPCVENMPKLNQEAALHPDVQFISLARDKMKSWTRYVRKHSYVHLYLALIDGNTEPIYSPGVPVFPTYMIIDRSGEILYGPVHTVDDVIVGLGKL